MSEPLKTHPGLAAAERGSLVLTDISGYTDYLLGTELEHAQDVLADLLGVVVGRLRPALTVSKLEGDAVFSYALDGTCGASTLLDTIEQTYFAFCARQRDIAHATSCTCDACRRIPSLDLKFVVHHGSFVRRELAGSEELTGREVIVLHRLAKNSAADVLGTRGYVLLTDACVEALALDPVALGLRAHTETYDDVGEVACCLEDLSERWRAESERRREYVPSEGATFERSLSLRLEPVELWNWLTDPVLRSQWDADLLEPVTPGGRQRPGVTNHCFHGEDVIVEHIVDWRPFDYYTMSYDLPGVGAVRFTTELVPAGDETTVFLRGEPLEGERREAWSQIEGFLLETIDASFASLSEHVARAKAGSAAS